MSEDEDASLQRQQRVYDQTQSWSSRMRFCPTLHYQDPGLRILQFTRCGILGWINSPTRDYIVIPPIDTIPVPNGFQPKDKAIRMYSNLATPNLRVNIPQGLGSCISPINTSS